MPVAVVVVFGLGATYCRRMMLRCLPVVAAVMVCAIATAAAQEPTAVPDSVPVDSADEPRVAAPLHVPGKIFLLTNSGAYVQLAGYRGAGFRAMLDWGPMVNLSARDAVGATWFLTFERTDANFSTGPVLHWRRWLGPRQSLDVALGTPISGGRPLRPGSLLGLVKYSPAQWFGIAARPELIRHDEYGLGATSDVPPPMRTDARLYVGPEFGAVPGVALGVAGAVTLGLVVLAFVLSGEN